jgi:cell division protein FtsI/penicillin-binding protein 2
MKGGAVVAMVPQTGEVVAMASYPRFDPNDFVPTRDPELRKEKTAAVQKWLEGDAYMGEIWDGKRPLEREFFSFLKGSYQQEQVSLSWDRYLEAILPTPSSILTTMQHIHDLQTATRIQEIGEYHPLLKGIKLEEDKKLVLDLCHLGAPQELFSPALLQAIGAQSLSEYHALRQCAMRLQGKIKSHIQELYHDHDFTAWRQTHFKEYLKKKRKEEKEQHKYTKPYTEYLDQVEKKLFNAFWEAYRLVFLHTLISETSPIPLQNYPHLHPYLAHLRDLRPDLIQNDPTVSDLQRILKNLDGTLGLAYLGTMRSFEDLKQPLVGRYRRMRHLDGVQTEKHLAAAFYPLNGYGYGRSQAFRQTNPLGSVFKLVPTYQCLLERYQQHKELNPLTLIDDLKGDRRSTSMSQVLGYFLDGKPILRRYKGGILPRSSYSGMGKLDIIGALEQSSNIYFSIIAAEYIEDPMNLVDATRQFGFGDRTGADIAGEEKGNIPNDLAQNLTGLYSFAIGQHTLLVTPLQTSVMLSAIGLQGDVVTPKIVKRLEGKQPVRGEDLIFSAARFPYQEALALVGIDFPLFTETQKDQQETSVYSPPTVIQRSIVFPSEVHRVLTEGMRRSVVGPRGSARLNIMRNLYDHPHAIRDYAAVKNDIIAKTGTAQVRYKQTIDAETPAEMRVFIWFAALAYPPGKGPEGEPELAVVVLLRFGRAGRDAGPIAAQVIKKWRELRDKYEEPVAKLSAM